ncbi:TonB-dependent receptor [Halioxenophilus sp. WMMB6]|uniref:TonB-dependent receptor n=1 Tax=Halioxenophilus sp. WMMB6 TaxID=3073815 RepID=UPI00295EDCF4|nr:TonB-dependent receptor [Halioxenophilus sp. WMMB6]
MKRTKTPLPSIQTRSFFNVASSHLVLCSSAGLLTISGAVAAQDDPAATNVIEEVVVTAQRKEQRLTDVPFTVNALSDTQLEKAGVTNIFDLQNTVAGLTFGGVGNLTQPAIRGLSTGVSTNGSENPNALYVDDVYYSQGNLFGANLPDIQRIEVLKGPQGTLFGRNSVGGAIRLFTKDPTFENSGNITVDSGYYTGEGDSQSSPHNAVRGFVSIPMVSDTLAMSLSGGYDHTDGFLTDDESGDQYGTVVRSNARVKFLYQPTDSIKAVVSGFYLKHNDEGLQSATPYNGWVVASLYPGSVVSSTPYHTAFDSGNGLEYNDAIVKSSGGSARIEFDIGDIGTLTSITAYHDTEVFNQTTLPQAKGSVTCVTTFACVDYYYLANNKGVSQEFNFASEKIGIVSYTAGLFYYNQDSSTVTAIQETVVPGGIPVKTNKFKINSAAVYGQADIDLTEAWTLSVGGRYTREPHEDTITYPIVETRKETFESFIPRISLQYELSPSANIYATYSEGEKSGLTGIDNTASNPPYQSIDPEENNAYEVGYKYAAASLAVNLSAFYYDYKNKQEQGFTGGAVFVQNTGPVEIYGIDADATVQLSNEFILKGGLSWVPVAEYTDFEGAVGYTVNVGSGVISQVVFDATGERLMKAPELTANLSLDYEKSTDAGFFDASANVSYSSKVYHDIYQVIEQDDYFTLSARAGYTFSDLGLRVGIYGRNLTGEDYIAHGFPSGQGFTAAYARPQELGLSLNYSY